MLLHDPYALHRKWWDRDWKPELGDDAWTDWDFVLAEVYQLIEDYTDNQSGQIMWFDQSGDVYWEARSVFSGSMAEIERVQKERGELKRGESLYAVPIFADPENKPTLSSWIADIESQKADLRPGHLRDSRPPNAEELAAMNNAQ